MAISRWRYILLCAVLPAALLALLLDVTPAQAQAAPGYWYDVEWTLESDERSTGTTATCTIIDGFIDCSGTLNGASSWYYRQILDSHRSTITDTWGLVLTVTRSPDSNNPLFIGDSLDDNFLLTDNFSFAVPLTDTVICFNWSGAPSSYTTWASSNCDYSYDNRLRGGSGPGGDSAYQLRWQIQKGSSQAYDIQIEGSFVYAGPIGGGGGGSTVGDLVTTTLTYAGWLCRQTTITTDAVGITTTTIVTVPANLLSNYSYETGSASLPDNWSTAVNGAVQPIAGIWWINGLAYANSGYYAVSNPQAYDLIQSLPLYSAGDYLMGFYARCIDGSCDPTAMSWNGTTELSTSAMTNTYTIYTGTHTTGGGGAWLAIELPAGGDTYIDDAFILPMVDGVVTCDPDYYPPGGGSVGTAPPDCVIDPNSGSCIWAPTAGAGTTCYYCSLPASVGYDLGLWIAWLGCVIRNMFSCSLRVWLFDLTNSLRAVMGSIVMAVNWFNVEVAGAIAWGQSHIVGLLYFLSDIYVAVGVFLAAAPRQITVITSVFVDIAGGSIDWLSLIWDIIRFLFDLFVSLLGALYNGVLGFINMLIDGIGTIRLALTAPPFAIDDFVNAADPDGSATIPGATTAAALSYLIIGMATVDQFITDISLWPLIYTILGAGGISLIYWYIGQWKRNIFPT